MSLSSFVLACLLLLLRTYLSSYVGETERMPFLHISGKRPHSKLFLEFGSGFSPGMDSILWIQSSVQSGRSWLSHDSSDPIAQRNRPCLEVYHRIHSKVRALIPFRPWKPV